ncbi:sensor histidine kinase, partial [Salmonella enterica]|nr:sensor histidine kinase [Salmonella enterica]ECQ0237288.1 sensor histidine kinase [Salmonella enterica]
MADMRCRFSTGHNLYSIVFMIILSFTSVLHAESYQQRHIIRVGILSFDDINKGISR